MTDTEYKGPLQTDLTCDRRGSKLIKESGPEMRCPYYCPGCNENMYSFEVEEKS